MKYVSNFCIIYLYFQILKHKKIQINFCHVTIKSHNWSCFYGYIQNNKLWWTWWILPLPHWQHLLTDIVEEIQIKNKYLFFYVWLRYFWNLLYIFDFCFEFLVKNLLISIFNILNALSPYFELSYYWHHLNDSFNIYQLLEWYTLSLNWRQKLEAKILIY